MVPITEHENYHGEDGFNDVGFDDQPDISRVRDEKAWSVISWLSKEYPGEINLVAIGPLTNVAIAMLADPGKMKHYVWSKQICLYVDLSKRLKHLYIMGGNHEGIGNVTKAAEFNFFADPEAAHTVLRLTVSPTTIASWELSYKYNFVPLSWRKNVLGKLETPQAKLINKLEEVGTKLS